MKDKWNDELAQWRARPLDDLEVVYMWVDGVYVKAGLEREKAAILVVMAALSDGRKVVVSAIPGYRESIESWSDVLRDMRRRGLECPRLVIGDGHLGIWGALRNVYPQAAEQRCWNHKILNVLDRLPKRQQDQAKLMLRTIPYAQTRTEAERLRTEFTRWCRDHSYEAACVTLERDWDRMITFYDFPKEHWQHLRTTNPVESPFAALRLRTDAAKRYKRVDRAIAVIWKMLMVAEQRFRRLNWATPQTVTVTAVDDAVVEGAHTGTITHSASGGSYDGVSISNVVANVTDNDTVSVTITETAASTDVVEGGAVDTYDLVLDQVPSGTVTITLSSDAQATGTPAVLTFTTANWSTPQTVTATAINDAVVEGAHTGTITHSASGGSFDGVFISNVVANITDNDTASVTITETAATTDVVEGGATDTYDVVLDLEPSGTVTITISSDADATTTPASLNFTTVNWATLQTVTVSAINDAVLEGSHTGTITHSASGGSYDGVSISNVVANVTDDDGSVTVTEPGGSTNVTEGGATDTYDVVLDLEPSGTVTITLSPDADVSLSASSLTFTTGNWSVPQTVTVTAEDDAESEGTPHMGTTTHSASGGDYDGVSIASVVANITDNDAGLVLEQLEYRWFTNADSVPPGAALAAQDTPLTDAVEGTPYHLRVSIKGSFADFEAGEAFKLQYSTSLSGPWSDLGGLTATTTWRGYDNPSAADGTTLSTNQLSSATILETYEETNDTAATPTKIDKSKSGEWAWVVQPNNTLANTTYYFRMVRQNGTILNTYTTYPQVDMVDRSVTITESASSTDVVENGATDTYDVVLDVEPSGTVTIALSPDADVSLSTTTLAFTTVNWATPQTVTVTAVNDALLEGAHTGTITHSASGGGYNGVSISDVVANITDDDVASVTVTESAGSTDVTEGGATDTYTVVLDLEPSGTEVAPEI